MGGDADGSAGVNGGVGAIACRCCPRMSWHSKNGHGCVGVVCDVYLLITECHSALELLAPCVNRVTVFEHEGKLGWLFDPNVAKIQRHLVVVGYAGCVQDLFKSLGYWSMHRVTAERMGRSKMFI